MIEDRLRMLVVDDTVTYRAIVSATLTELPDVEVVGLAANGKIALQKIEQLRPDLLTLDLEMPEMDGLELLRRLKHAQSGISAIMLSAFTTKGAESTMAALKLGAFDFVLKPSGGERPGNAEKFRQELHAKIDAFRRNRQIRAILQGGTNARPGGTAASSSFSTAVTAAPEHAAASPLTPPAGYAQADRFDTLLRKPIEVIALGISTGGPEALTRMLPRLPADLGVPLLIVQHMPPIFTRSLAEDLGRRCALCVYEATDGQAVEPGSVLIAPGGKQMKVEVVGDGPVVRITDDLPENSCRPSVHYLFRSVAEVYGASAVGVIMTGMGNDGARGCRAMHQRGASIIAQDQASCVVFGMPREPIEEGIAVAVPLEGIAGAIVKLTGRGAVACR